jgi:hypothetical protein
VAFTRVWPLDEVAVPASVATSDWAALVTTRGDPGSDRATTTAITMKRIVLTYI